MLRKPRKLTSAMSVRCFGLLSGLLVIFATTGSAQADLVLAPISAMVDAGGTGNGDISDTFNQNGLSTGYTSGVTNFDAYIASNPTHSAALTTEWVSAEDPGIAQVTYNLGNAFTINRLALWNEESTGITSLNLFTSTDGVGYTSLASNLTPTNNPIGMSYPADVFSFSATSAQFIRFVMMGPQSGSTFDGIGIGEVAFSQVQAQGIPEPTSLALLSLAAAGFGIGAYRRRRAGAASHDVQMS